MGGLRALVVFLGLVIVGMVATIVVTLVHRHASPAGFTPAASTALTLDEPAGTRIAAISTVGDRLAVLLQGGGPDRVVWVDQSGHVAFRLQLRR
jgi:hypothetical protein